MRYILWGIVASLLWCAPSAWAIEAEYEAAQEILDEIDIEHITAPFEEQESHEARHGGYFGDADDIYHYELLVDPSGLIVLYVNDELNQPLNVRDLEARLTIDPDGEAPAVLALRPIVGGEFFFVQVKEPFGNFLHVEVAVKKSGAWIAMEFPIPLQTAGENTRE
jgi:hypothetical protein